jgi:hypothetical protein
VLLALWSKVRVRRRSSSSSSSSLFSTIC